MTGPGLPEAAWDDERRGGEAVGGDERRGRGRRAMRSGPAGKMAASEAGAGGEVVTGADWPTVATGKVTGAGGAGGEVGSGRDRMGQVVAGEARTGEVLVGAGG